MPHFHLKSPIREHAQNGDAWTRRLQTLCGGCLLAAGLTATPALAQAPKDANKIAPPPLMKQATTPKGAAYYHFSLGHLYEEMAAAYDNRTDYVNKAIENFRLAIKEDPSATFLIEDIAELYRVSGRVREAVEEAEAALKANPDDINAHRVLAHIYTSQVGDAQANKIDEGMVRRAVEQYKIITTKDPKDVESFVMLGRLDGVLENSVDAEAAFKSAIALDADNEDAITGLASVYTGRGDTKESTALLEKLAQKNPSPRALVTLAQNYESMKQYDLAADTYKKALALDPSRAELRGALAQDQTFAERYDDALQTYQEMAAANAQDPSPYLGMVQIYEQQRKLDEARVAMDKAKQIDPESIEIRYDDARLLALEGKNADAIAGLKGIVDSTAKRSYDPAQKAARTKMLEELGGLYRSNDQNAQAVETFRQMVTLDPDNAARASAEIIDTYRLAKDYAKAQQESADAATKFPNDRVLHEVRAELLSDQGKTDASVAELKKLVDGKSDRDVYLKIADTYQKGKNFSEMAKALDAAEKLSTTDEDRANITFMRGEMYERQKKYDLAEKEFRKVVDQNGKNASALNYLGYMLADQGLRLQEASGYIERAVALEPNNYAFLDSLGWVYFHMNRLDDAEKQLRRSLQLMSKDPTIHDHLGDVYFKKGKLKEAIAEWQSTVKQIGTSSPADVEPDELAKVQKKLDSARVRLAKEQNPPRSN